MSDFPSISAVPLNEIPYEPVDNAVVSDPENGMTISRKRFTRDIWIIGDVYYDLGPSDLVLIKAHWASVGTHSKFNITLNGNIYTVRYRKPIKFVDLPAGRTHIKISLKTA